MNDELVASVTELAVEHALPSASCLQLASAINLKKALEPMREELILIRSDKELCRSAEKEGIEFIDSEERDALEKLSKLPTLPRTVLQ